MVAFYGILNFTYYSQDSDGTQRLIGTQWASQMNLIFLPNFNFKMFLKPASNFGQSFLSYPDLQKFGGVDRDRRVRQQVIGADSTAPNIFSITSGKPTTWAPPTPAILFSEKADI